MNTDVERFADLHEIFLRLHEIEFTPKMSFVNPHFWVGIGRERVGEMLNITSSYEECYKLLGRNHTLVIRPYTGEQTLILGCGNSSIKREEAHEHYHVRLGMKKVPLVDRGENKHSHIGEYTIDMDITKNPSVVSILGKDRYSHIPDRAFKKIRIEYLPHKILVEYKNYPAFFPELSRMLAEGGEVFICYNLTYDIPFVRKEGGKIFGSNQQVIIDSASLAFYYVDLLPKV